MGSETDIESSTPSLGAGPVAAGASAAGASAAGASAAGASAVPVQGVAHVPASTTAPAFAPPIPRQLHAAAWPRRRRSDHADAPRLRQLMGVCGWAAVLGGIGLIIGLRGQIGILSGETPTWYEPALMGVGVVGILLTVAAFLTVNRRRAPWIFLSSSSVALIVAMSLTSTAF